MKRKIFTLLFCSAVGFTYAQDASDFGANDILIANFETKSPVVLDSLWTDTFKTTPITAPSTSITLADNPFPLENTSATAAKYVRDTGGWKSLYIRFSENIVLSRTPYLQIQVYPVAGKSPANTSVNINLLNDKGEVVYAGGYRANLPQDVWTTVTAFLGKQKSSVLYNTIEIQINNGDTAATNHITEYYIDQIGFKAPADGVELPATILYETFGGYNGDWENQNVPGQKKNYYLDDKGKLQLIGEVGTTDIYASINGFTSGIPFTFKDILADTVALFTARTWGMGAKYEGASGNGRMMLASKNIGTLETGDIDVTGTTNLNLSFGLGTQTWWPYNSDIASARPKVEISVNGRSFYEIFSNSTFLQFTGQQDDLGWGLMDKYEDQIFTLVEYPFTTIAGAALSGVNTINLRMSYKAGTDFWIDDLWLSGISIPSSLSATQSEVFAVYPNPASNYILTPNATKVTITDLNGRIVKESFNAAKVDVSSLAKGAYIVKVKNSDATKIGKLIKK